MPSEAAANSRPTECVPFGPCACAASYTVRPVLLLGGRGGSAVDTVVVAPGTSSSDGRVLGNWSKFGGAVFSSYKIKPKHPAMIYTRGCIRRCSLVLFASSAGAAGAGAGTAAATALLLLLLGVFFLPLLRSNNMTMYEHAKMCCSCSCFCW